jgi:hypothetical protein
VTGDEDGAEGSLGVDTAGLPERLQLEHAMRIVTKANVRIDVSVNEASAPSGDRMTVRPHTMSKIGYLRPRASSALFSLALGATATSVSAAERVPPEAMLVADDAALAEGRRIERTWQSYWLVPSATLLGLSYFVSLSGAAASEFQGPYASLAIPFAGPFIALTKRSTVCEREGRASDFWCTFSLADGDTNMTVALLVDGFVQVASGTLLALTFDAPRYQFERRDLWGLRVAPGPVGTGHGLRVGGSF